MAALTHWIGLKRSHDPNTFRSIIWEAAQFFLLWHSTCVLIYRQASVDNRSRHHCGTRRNLVRSGHDELQGEMRIGDRVVSGGVCRVCRFIGAEEWQPDTRQVSGGHGE